MQLHLLIILGKQGSDIKRSRANVATLEPTADRNLPVMPNTRDRHRAPSVQIANDIA
jgi:hypothetical protein